MSEKDKSLKELLAEFEGVVEWFDENEDLDVEKAIKQYEKGAKLAETIKSQLEKAKNEIEKVN